MIKREHLILLRRINEMDKKAKHLGDTLDKIYSMVFDLETKFMGVDRAEQIGMPERHAQKLADKMKREPNWNGKGKL